MRSYPLSDTSRQPDQPSPPTSKTSPGPRQKRRQASLGTGLVNASP